MILCHFRKFSLRKEQFWFGKFESQYKYFLSRKLNWINCLQNICHFIEASMCYVVCNFRQAHATSVVSFYLYKRASGLGFYAIFESFIFGKNNLIWKNDPR